jgi:hypothetical protein
MPVVHQLTAAKRDSANQPDKLQIGELADLDKMADLPEMNGQLANFEKKWHPVQINNNSAQAGFKQRSWHQPNQYNGTQAE